MSTCPYVKGYASGLSVGLPDGQMGNSEVGHLNMGAGRIVYQELTRITKEIEDGVFFENKGLLEAVENCKKNNSALYLFGFHFLLSGNYRRLCYIAVFFLDSVRLDNEQNFPVGCVSDSF